jgi:hypothetical protein
MTDQDPADAAFKTFSERLIRREALRRAALELSTTTPAGLESALARISDEVTAEAAVAKEDRALPTQRSQPARSPPGRPNHK